MTNDSSAATARRVAMLGLLAGALLWAGGVRADEVAVSIDNFTFSPARIVVPVGSAVTWTNADDIPHTVTASDKAFRSKPLDTSDRFTFVFAKPGEYGYFCSLHPHMTGTILVKAP